MELFECNSELYKANCDPTARVYVNQGGTSSGKTYCIMQRIIAIALTEPYSIITVVGQDLPNLKVGAMRDLKTMLQKSQFLSDQFSENRSDLTFTSPNGSIIEFKSYDDEQDAKSGKRDYLFVNEADGITYGIYWQLQMRTRKKVWLDYNPSSRFWVHDKVIGGDGVRLIISDHRANRFLAEAEHKRIENTDDRELWLVYARGLTGKLTGLVYPRFNVVDRMPPISECKAIGHGLDFGFTNDPASLVEVRLAHGELWVDEVIYETGLTNPDIANRCHALGITKKHKIVADGAEPKSIQELRNLGLWVVPSVKGADSINAGIDTIRRYPINVTRRSRNIIKEMGIYKYKVDRDGKTTNAPIDKFNHAMDAMRYVCTDMLTTRRTGTAKYNPTYLYQYGQ